jgi:hypothetical protein
MPWYLFLGILYAYSGCMCNCTGLAQATQAVLPGGLYIMYAQAVQSVRPAESTTRERYKEAQKSKGKVSQLHHNVGDDGSGRRAVEGAD